MQECKYPYVPTLDACQSIKVRKYPSMRVPWVSAGALKYARMQVSKYEHSWDACRSVEVSKYDVLLSVPASAEVCKYASVRMSPPWMSARALKYAIIQV